MDKIIEQLRKEAQPIVLQCTGKGLTPEQMDRLDGKHPVCSRIDPIEVFEIIDEETGQVDDEVGPELSSVDEACRCTAYAFPSAKWRNGVCPLATHILAEEDTATGKVRVGQQKQKKR
jgi:hypothetical protein